jgi:hypothetical protein
VAGVIVRMEENLNFEKREGKMNRVAKWRESNGNSERKSSQKEDIYNRRQG